VDSFEREIVLSGLDRPDPLPAVFIRAPWVEQVGEGVTVLGTEASTGRIVAVRQGQLLATAFHPELTPDRRIHQLFVEIVKDNT
jgi:5'-phosphate synthase pdxT subunit